MKKTIIMMLAFMLSLSLSVFADDNTTATDSGQIKTDTKGYERSQEVNKGKQGELKKSENAAKRELKKEKKEEKKNQKKELKKEKRGLKKQNKEKNKDQK